MDEITAAIIGAFSKLSQSAVSDAYRALKALLIKRLGPDNEVSRAMATGKEKPISKRGRKALKDAVASSAIGHDAEILGAARKLASATKDVGRISVSQRAGKNATQVGIVKGDAWFGR